MIVEIERLGAPWGRIVEGDWDWVSVVCRAEARTSGGQSRIARDGAGGRRALEEECRAGLDAMAAAYGRGYRVPEWIPMGLVSWLWSRETNPALRPRVILRRPEGPCLVSPGLGSPTGAYLRATVSDVGRPLDEKPLLRDYQVDLVIQAFDAPWGRCILSGACGVGKTHVAAGILAAGRGFLGGDWLYVVPNTELALQTEKSLQRTMPPLLSGISSWTESTRTAASRIGRRVGKDQGQDGWWTVVSLGALAVASGSRSVCSSRGGPVASTAGVGVLAREWTGVIVDEAHRAVMTTGMEALLRVRGRMWVGLSATPCGRMDSRNMLTVGLLGPVLGAGAGVQEMTAGGFLSPAHVVN